MLNYIDEIKIHYKNVFLTQIKLKNQMSIHAIVEAFEQDLPHEFTISMPNIFKDNLIACNIKESYLFGKQLFGISISNILKKDDWQIIKYIDILEFLADSDFID